MPDFPRGTGAKPRLCTVPAFPVGLQSWGGSGKGQFRAVQNMGRVWDETYPILDTSLATVRALIESINRGVRQGIVWDVQHPYWQVRKGAAGGAPLVAGANQIGAVLNIDGASAGITNWLRQGDLIKVPGCAVVFDVTADVNTDGSGLAAIPISPPIFVGQSPADDVAVNVDPTTIKFKAVIANVSSPFPHMDSTRYLDAGLVVTFREQPQ